MVKYVKNAAGSIKYVYINATNIGIIMILIANALIIINELNNGITATKCLILQLIKTKLYCNLNLTSIT